MEKVIEIIKKQLRKICENENKENIDLEKEEKYRNIKNITFIKRDVLARRQKGYFSEAKEAVLFENKTDKQIDKELKELNKMKRSRFFEIDARFNLMTKKGKKEAIKYLLDKEIQKELTLYL